MALKFKHRTKAEIPAELQSLYVERDGAWLLDVDGAVDKAKLDDFPANNITVMKECDALNQSGTDNRFSCHPCQTASLRLSAGHERRA